MQKILKKEIVIFSLLFLISVPAINDLFIPGGFTSHDLNHHVIRQVSMDKLLSEGQIPPRWSGELNHEYGYPVFLFNYPLPPLLGEIIHLLGWGFVDSTKGVFLISILISGIGMYLFLRSLLGNKQSLRPDGLKLAAFLGAVFWVYAPVRFLNVYVAAALGNALACGIIPYVFWCATEVIKTRRAKWVIWGGVFLSLLIMTHNVSTIMFLPVLILYSVVVGNSTHSFANAFGALRLRLGYARFARLRLTSFGASTPTVGILIMFLLGFGLSAWFWLPAIWDKQYIRYDSFMAGFYRDRFIDFWALIRSRWGYGGDFSNQIGLAHLLAVVTLVFSILYLVFRRKINKELLVLGSFSLIVFIISVFLTQKISLVFWDHLPFLSYIQFPNRWLTVTVFSACLAVALVIKYLPYQKIIVGCLLILVIYANRNHWHINQSTYHTDEYYRSLKTTATAYDEHLPIWAKPMEQVSSSKYQVLRGKGRITVLENKSNNVTAEIDAEEPLSVRFNQFYFPGWKILVDGKEVKFDYLKEGEDYGLPVFISPSGKHILEAKFSETGLRLLADVLSLVSIGLVLFFFTRSLQIRFR